MTRLADIMTTKVETISEDCSAEEAWYFLRSRKIHHLVVQRGKRVVGVVSERDLGGPRGKSVREGRSIGELMSATVITADPRAPVRSAANLLRGRSIGCLPVMKGEALVGIVTLTDLLSLLGRGWEIRSGRTRRGMSRGNRAKPNTRRK